MEVCDSKPDTGIADVLSDRNTGILKKNRKRLLISTADWYKM